MAAEPRIIVDGERGRRRLALGPELTVGRAEGSGLRLAGREVSRRHARFSCVGGVAFVEDLESRNGTFVNGERVHGGRRLRPGDVVRVGDELLRYEDGDATEELPPATPPPLPRRATPAPERVPAEGEARPGESDRTEVAKLAPARRGLRGALAAALRALRSG
jgi:pSer/pThr/pTyr-binding forkhead associated (FHA) protein